MSKFHKLNDAEVHIILDFNNQVSEYQDVCECDESCYPKSRLVCQDCSLAIDAVAEDLRVEIMDIAESAERHDHREGYLDDGEMFYNHHEANDSWYN